MAAAPLGCEGILRKRDALNRWISRYVVFQISPDALDTPVLEDGPTAPATLPLPAPHPAFIAIYRTEAKEAIDETFELDFGQLVFRVEELFPKVRWPTNIPGAKGFGLLFPKRKNGLCFHADGPDYMRWKSAFERFEKMGHSTADRFETIGQTAHVLKMPLLPHSVDLIRSDQYPIFAAAIRRLYTPSDGVEGRLIEDYEIGSNTDYDFRFPDPTILYARLQPSQRDPRSYSTMFVILVNVVRCRAKDHGGHRPGRTCFTDKCEMSTRLVEHSLGDFYKLRETLMQQGHLSTTAQNALPKISLDPRHLDAVYSIVVETFAQLFDEHRFKLQNFLNALGDHAESKKDINYRFFLVRENRSTPLIHKAIMQMDMGKLTQVLSSSERLTELTATRETVIHTAVRTSAALMGRGGHTLDELPPQDPLRLLLDEEYPYRAIILGVISEQNSTGETVLHVAVELNHVAAVRELLKIQQVKDAVDLHNNEGEAALHIAARHCNRFIVELLVGTGQASVLLQTKYERRTVFNRTARQLIPRHIHLIDAPYVRAYLKECAKSYTLKLLMVGPPGTGKSTVINACLGLPLDRRLPASTRGIQVSALRGHDTHGDLQFWDFPGPEEMNAGLEFTLRNQKRCIFVLTLKVADFDVDISSGYLEAQLRFWLKCATTKTAALRREAQSRTTSRRHETAPAPAAAAAAAVDAASPLLGRHSSDVSAPAAAEASVGAGAGADRMTVPTLMVTSAATSPGRTPVVTAPVTPSPLRSTLSSAALGLAANRFRGSVSAINLQNDLGYRAAAAEQRARHEGSKAVVVLVFTHRDKFHGAEESSVLDFLSQMVNRAYFQFGQDVEFLVDESFDQGRPYFWLSNTGRAAYTQAANFVRHMQAVTTIVTRAYQRPVTKDCLRGLAWVKLWRQALSEGEMARVRYKPRSYDELRTFILQRDARELRADSKLRRPRQTSAAPSMQALRRLSHVILQRNTEQVTEDAAEGAEEEQQALLLAVLESLKELEEIYWVEQDDHGVPLNIHVDVSWLVGASLERLLLLESALQPNHILNLNAISRIHSLPSDVACFVSDLAIEYAFAPERPNLFLLLRDLIALKVVFGFELPQHVAAGGTAHVFTANESIAPHPDALQDDLPARFLLVPSLMPTSATTLQKITRWKDAGGETSTLVLGKVITPENDNHAFPPYVISQLVIFLITNKHGLQFVWREGVQFRLKVDDITFSVRFVLPGAEPMQVLDNGNHSNHSTPHQGTTGADRRVRIMQAKELSAAIVDRLQYLEVHVVHKYVASDEFLEGGRSRISAAAARALDDAIAMAFSVLENDYKTIRLRTQYLTRWPQEYGRPSLFLDDQETRDEVFLHTNASASLVNEQIAVFLQKRELQTPLERPADLLNCAQDCCHLSNLVYQPDLYDVLTVNKMQRLLTKIVWRYDAPFKIEKETIKLVKSPLDSTVMKHKLIHTAGFLVFLRGGIVYVCMRGTNSFGDAVIDGKLRRYNLAEKEGLDRSAANAEVHMGFYQMAVAVRRAFFDVMGYPSRAYERIRNLPLVLCGHSLGGATAQLLHGLLQCRDPDTDASMWRGPVFTFTFGSPLVGNASFASWMPHSERILNFVLHNDPVPHALLKRLLYVVGYVSGVDRYTPAGTVVMIDQYGSLPLVIATKTAEGQNQARDCLLRSRKLLIARHRIELSYQPELADPDTILWAAEVVYKTWRVPLPPSRAISAVASPEGGLLPGTHAPDRAHSPSGHATAQGQVELPTSPNHPGVPSVVVLVPTPEDQRAPIALAGGDSPNGELSVDSASTGDQLDEPDGEPQFKGVPAASGVGVNAGEGGSGGSPRVTESVV
eukprot:m.130513 g.130513  ORF g.130513 m.130513 type:complete len:1835 (-) comp14777_c0_seq2:26-5530(-)